MIDYNDLGDLLKLKNILIRMNKFNMNCLFCKSIEDDDIIVCL